MARNTEEHTDRRRLHRQRALACPGLPPLPDARWAPAQGGPPAALARSVQGKGDREGRRGGQGSWGVVVVMVTRNRSGRGGPGQLIPFLVLCWLWRGFLGLGGGAGPLGGLGGLLPGGGSGGGGGGRGGWGREGPCCCRGLGHRGGCRRGLATHAKLIHPRGVDAVDPPLVEVDEEDHIWGVRGAV